MGASNHSTTQRGLRHLINQLAIRWRRHLINTSGEYNRQC